MTHLLEEPYPLLLPACMTHLLEEPYLHLAARMRDSPP